MKLPTSNDSDRGQVGIGTLIIFIALVLVSAVAAGVLINTAGDLQSRASDTGSDAQAQVSNQIDVVSASGEVDTTNDQVTKLTLVVKKSPGSDPIDLSAATIQYTSAGESVTLTEGTGTGQIFEVDPVTATANDDKALDNNRERIRLKISLSDAASNLAQGEDAQLKIVDQSGASTVYGVNVPDVLTSTYVEV
jgi:flagellin-like protein